MDVLNLTFSLFFALKYSFHSFDKDDRPWRVSYFAPERIQKKGKNGQAKEVIVPTFH